MASSFNFNSFFATTPFEQLVHHQEQPCYSQTGRDLLGLGSLNLGDRRVREIRSTTTILTPNRVVVQTVLDLADPQCFPNQFHGQHLAPARISLGQLWVDNQYYRQPSTSVRVDLGQPWEAANQFNGQLLAPTGVGQGQLREVSQFHGEPLAPSRVGQIHMWETNQFHGQYFSPKRLNVGQLWETYQFRDQHLALSRVGQSQPWETNQFHGQSLPPRRLGLSQFREANQFDDQPLAIVRPDQGQLREANQFSDQPWAYVRAHQGQQWDPIPPSGVRPIILSNHPMEEGDMFMDDGQLHNLETGRKGVYECPFCRMDFYSSQSFASHIKVVHYANETSLEKKRRLHAKYMAKIMKRRWKLLRPWMVVGTHRTRATPRRIRVTRRRASINVDPDLSSLKIERGQQ